MFVFFLYYNNINIFFSIDANKPVEKTLKELLPQLEVCNALQLYDLNIIIFLPHDILVNFRKYQC